MTAKNEKQNNVYSILFIKFHPPRPPHGARPGEGHPPRPEHPRRQQTLTQSHVTLSLTTGSHFTAVSTRDLIGLEHTIRIADSRHSCCVCVARARVRVSAEPERARCGVGGAGRFGRSRFGSDAKFTI